MVPTVFQPAFQLNWSQWRARPALPCMVSIVAALAVGMALHRPGVGTIAAGGAMSVGMGSFQQVGHSRVKPMLWASVGMGLSALGGSLVGHAGSGAMLNAAWAGFASGLLVAIGPGAAWVGLQCAIASLVASGYPVGVNAAFGRVLLLVAGGLVQTGVVVAFWHFQKPWRLPAGDDPYTGLLPALRTLWANFSFQSSACRFAGRQAITLVAATGLAHYGRLPNGYWVPMTALLVMKPDFQQTIQRGLARVGGTVIGAGLATLLVTELRPNLLMLGALIVLFAWLAYALVLVNYAVFSICLTAYIVFLLAFAGLPARAVVWHRTLNTTLGGGLALLSYVTLLRLGARQRAAAGVAAAASMIVFGLSAPMLQAQAATPAAGTMRTILFFGDSLTAGYGLEDASSQAFPALIQQRLRDAGLNFGVINAGLSGDTTAGGLRRIDWAMRQPVDILVLELGGNDGLRGVPIEETRRNLQGIIDRVRARNPAARVVVAGMRLPPNFGADYVAQFAEMYPALVKANPGATLLPFLLEGVGGEPRYNQRDQIHPTAEGHRLIAETLWTVLAPLCRSVAPGA